MRKIKVEKTLGILMIILSVFMFFSKEGELGFVIFIIGLFLYIYSRKGTDYRSM